MILREELRKCAIANPYQEEEESGHPHSLQFWLYESEAPHLGPTQSSR